ncbi:MAG: hypothetical protein AB7N76_09135 [Planctomycetota bacterium]
MSDERLRALERRFHETGDPADEEGWLRERVRGGELSLDSLRFAAALGHAVARSITAAPAPVEETARQLKRVLRVGVLTGPVELERLEDPRVVVPWLADCLRHLGQLAAQELEADLALAERLVAGADDPEEGVLARAQALSAAGGSPDACYLCVAAARTLRLALGARRLLRERPAVMASSAQCKEALEIAGAAAQVAATWSHPGEVEWQRERLLQRLLGPLQPLEPIVARREDARARPSTWDRQGALPAGVDLYATSRVIPALAALPHELRAAAWSGLDRVLAGTAGANLRPVPGGGPWAQLRLTPETAPSGFARLRRWLGARLPPPSPHLLLRRRARDAVELVLVERCGFRSVLGSYQDGAGELEPELERPDAPPLPETFVDAWSLMGSYGDLPHWPIRHPILREATEHLADVLARYAHMSEAEREQQVAAHAGTLRMQADRRARDDRRAAATPALREASRELLANGARRGPCPRCEVVAELRVMRAEGFALCYRCYFDWW